jgi:hypothetical protein
MRHDQHAPRICRLAMQAICCLVGIALAGEAAQGQTFPELVVQSETDIRSDDLIRLSTSYAEAVQEFRTAELRLKTLRVLGGNSNVTGLEVQIAQIDLSVAESKLRILQAIGEKLLAIAVARGEFYRRLQQEGNLPVAPGGTTSPQLRQAEADLRILQMILAMNPLKPAPVEQLPQGN